MTSAGRRGTGPADLPGGLDPAQSLRMIEESQHRARSGTEPDGRLLFGTWAVAWGVGFLVLWLSARSTGGSPDGPAFAVFAVALAAAVAITIVHTVRRTAGTRGPGARAGAMWGWGWCVGFLVYPLVVGGIARAGASDDVIGLVANALSCLIVGLMYIGGAACFGETRLFVLGLWIVLIGGAATMAGMPGTYLVMCVAGGSGFLVMCLVEIAVAARRRRRSDAHPVRPAVGQGGDDG
jgi:hypothetical protein